MHQVTVFGGGSFGTALAQLCAIQGMKVHLWMRDQDRAQETEKSRFNSKYFQHTKLADRITVSADLNVAIASAEWMIIAVPSEGFRDFLTTYGPVLPEVPLLLGVKGLEPESLMTMLEVAIDVLGPSWRKRILVLSGPSFASEIMLRKPTAVVLAGADPTLNKKIANLLSCGYFRAYQNHDVIGVEMGGALKNVIAIAVGCVEGLELGENARATLLTRGLGEIVSLAVAKGGQPLTLSGLAGVGDLTLTCTGRWSRNRRVGVALGRGLSVTAAIAEVGQVVEGVVTAKSAFALAEHFCIEAPIVRTVYRVLYEGLRVRDAVDFLIERPVGDEFTLSS